MGRRADLVDGFRDQCPGAAALMDRHEDLESAVKAALDAALAVGCDDAATRAHIVKRVAAWLDVTIAVQRPGAEGCSVCGRAISRRTLKRRTRG